MLEFLLQGVLLGRGEDGNIQRGEGGDICSQRLLDILKALIFTKDKVINSHCYNTI